MLDLILGVLFAVLSGVLALWLIRSELDLHGDDDSSRPQGREEADTTDDKADSELEEEAEETPGKHWTLRKPGFVLLFLCLTAIALFRYFYYEAPALNTISLMLLLGILWASAVIDYRSFRIPNRFLLVGLIARCVIFAVMALADPHQIKYVLLRSVIAAAALFLVALLCRLVSPKSIGFGDIKLLMLMGLYLSLDGIWGAVFCTMLVSFLVSLALLVARKVNRKTELPFAPFLLIGTILSSFLTYY